MEQASGDCAKTQGMPTTHYLNQSYKPVHARPPNYQKPRNNQTVANYWQYDDRRPIGELIVEDLAAVAQPLPGVIEGASLRVSEYEFA